MDSGLSFNRLLVSLIACFLLTINALKLDYPSVANVSNSWINSPPDLILNMTLGGFEHLCRLNPVLFQRSPASSSAFVCGFHCSFYNSSCVFGISIFPDVEDVSYTRSYIPYTRMVWSANLYNPVQVNATLRFNQEGDLVLTDADGTYCWSTNTKGKSVTGLSLTESGNLVLFDEREHVVWQSFDHPTNSLLPGQMLVLGQKLTYGLFTVTLKNEGLIAYVKANPPQVYYKATDPFLNDTGVVYNAHFRNGMLDAFRLNRSLSPQFMTLRADGHFTVYNWTRSGWNEAADLLTSGRGECIYPMVCGKYGVCKNGQCYCPESTSSDKIYFRFVDNQQPNQGCAPTVPLSCQYPQLHSLVPLENVYYSSFNVDINGTSLESCKKVCLSKCSCKATVFRYLSNSTNGDCCLLSEVFSLTSDMRASPYDPTIYKTLTFVKIQSPTPKLGEKTRKMKVVLLVVLTGLGFGLFVTIGTWYYLRNKNGYKQVEEDHLNNIPGMPTRFSYREMRAATGNFSRKLGEGGFGTVFLGTLRDGTKVAVKCLEGFSNVKKSFLTEFEAIGSIHHLNLVRLIGFCAEKSERLLVYEYMCNGSLDLWIFPRNGHLILNWQTRKKIILDIAKGLSYLHEECNRKIIHLDIKPQNILLDENFNAKLSDFGLSKLTDREQSRTITTMRGTPGYMAPEWLSRGITEKVDVYSFGVVVMEIICSRRNFDLTYSERDSYLLTIFGEKAEEGLLWDLVDKSSCLDAQENSLEIIKMMKIAAWCLQYDVARRPKMSEVIKVLEGNSLDIEDSLDYDFVNTRRFHKPTGSLAACTPLQPSVLSEPR